ncbi:hypothetical protein H4219_003041 [Mycoemilia scoparia]|uniref:Velvet domain-containing protein n=1 Tax=Mycoemilia scoparia TaxID=417184 RepID=A0A9W7ZVZ5_9FUNG|nr:hypothetical protein H4219_003041 [Mycoemilia scoparia]
MTGRRGTGRSSSPSNNTGQTRKRLFGEGMLEAPYRLCKKTNRSTPFMPGRQSFSSLDGAARVSYELVIVQQPGSTRELGFGDGDRRAIDPPPFVQLIIRDSDGNEIVPRTYETEGFVVNASLRSADDENDATVVLIRPSPAGLPPSIAETHPLQETRMLTWALVSSAYIVKDMDQKQCCYFVFPDLHVRSSGVFRLRFSLIRIPR